MLKDVDSHNYSIAFIIAGFIASILTFLFFRCYFLTSFLVLLVLQNIVTRKKTQTAK
jgi:hypothetical protein